MDRTGYIGGSDFRTLLNGCHLRLWKQKRGEPTTQPEETGAMVAGTKLEPIIIEEYKEKTGRKTKRHNGLMRHRDYQWAAAHVDSFTWATSGLVEPIAHGRGVVECKKSAPHNFRRFLRDGLPQEYVAQMQWYLYVTGLKWGAFAVLEPVEWQFQTFDIRRDDELIALLHEKASLFWGVVENGPAPAQLDAGDKLCRRCPYRDACHPDAPITEDLGDAVRDDSIEEIAAQLCDARAILRDAKQHEEECAKTLTEALGARTNVVSGDLKITRQTTPRAGYEVKPSTVTMLKVKKA